MTIIEYTKAYKIYGETKDDGALYAISDAIDKMPYDERISLRNEVAKLKLPMMNNLTYDYVKQCWITIPGTDKLFI